MDCASKESRNRLKLTNTFTGTSASWTDFRREFKVEVGAFDDELAEYINSVDNPDPDTRHKEIKKEISLLDARVLKENSSDSDELIVKHSELEALLETVNKRRTDAIRKATEKLSFRALAYLYKNMSTELQRKYTISERSGWEAFRFIDRQMSQSDTALAIKLQAKFEAFSIHPHETVNDIQLKFDGLIADMRSAHAHVPDEPTLIFKLEWLFRKVERFKECIRDAIYVDSREDSGQVQDLQELWKRLHKLEHRYKVLPVVESSKKSAPG